MRWLLLALLTFSFTAEAEHRNFVDRDISVGLTAGYVAGSSWSLHVGGPQLDDEIVSGFTVGAVSDFRLFHFILVSPELLLTRKGVKIKNANSVMVTYLEIPVLLKAKLDVEKSFNLYLLAGPKMAIKLGGSSYKTFGLAMDIGLGGEYVMSENVGLFLDARYDFALLNAAKASGSKIKLWAFSILLGFNYYLDEPN